MSIWLRSWSIPGWLCQRPPCSLGMSTAHTRRMWAYSARIENAHTPSPLVVVIVTVGMCHEHYIFGLFSCAWQSGHIFWTKVAWKYSPRKKFMDIFLGHKSLEHCSVGIFFGQFAWTVVFGANVADRVILDIITGKLFLWDSPRTYLKIMDVLIKIYISISV